MLFLDVKGAFPSMCVEHLVHNMRMQGVPREYTDWTYTKLKDRQTIVMFNDFVSAPYGINDGCDQGDPLSTLYYLFYNADLAGLSEGRKKELTIAYIDNVTLLAFTKSFAKAHKKIHHMFSREGRAAEWSRKHSSDFKLEKLKMIGFLRKRKVH